MGKGFSMLNFYLDLSEAIDDGGDVSAVDNSDFEGTSIPEPGKYTIPSNQFLSEDKREDLREWVLSAAMDTQYEQEPVTADFMGEVKMEIIEQLDHLVRRFDRDAIAIQD